MVMPSHCVLHLVEYPIRCRGDIVMSRLVLLCRTWEISSGVSGTLGWIRWWCTRIMDLRYLYLLRSAGLWVYVGSYVGWPGTAETSTMSLLLYPHCSGSQLKLGKPESSSIAGDVMMGA